MSKAKILVNSSALRIGIFFANALVAIVMMPFVIHSLGDRMYGLWILIGTFMGYYGLFDFGLGSVVQRFISSALAKKDHHEANVCANTMLVIYGAIGAILIIISIMAVFFAPALFKNVSDIGLFRKIVFILGLSLACGFPMRVFSGILIANIRYDLVSIIELGQLIIRTALVVFFLINGYGILALAIITLFVNWLGYITTFYFAKRLFVVLKFSISFVDVKKIKQYFSYSVFTFVLQLADMLRFRTSYFIIAAFVGLSAVTLYSIASRLITYFTEFIASAIGMTLPIFSGYESKGDYDSIREKYVFITKISSYLSMFIGSIMIIAGRAFIYKWMGQEYVQSYTIMVILLVPTIIALAQGSVYGLLLGISKHKFYAWLNIGEGVANMVLSIILVKRYGVIGVAYGVAIPMFIVRMLIQPIYVCNVIKLDIFYYLFKVIMPAITRSAIVITAAWLIFKSFIMPEYLSLAVFTSLQAIVFAVAIYMFGFTIQEKEYFVKLVKH